MLFGSLILGALLLALLLASNCPSNCWGQGLGWCLRLCIYSQTRQTVRSPVVRATQALQLLRPCKQKRSLRPHGYLHYNGIYIYRCIYIYIHIYTYIYTYIIRLSSSTTLLPKKVITAIFLKDTLDAAHNDAENLILDKMRKKAPWFAGPYTGY